MLSCVPLLDSIVNYYRNYSFHNYCSPLKIASAFKLTVRLIKIAFNVKYIHFDTVLNRFYVSNSK